MAFQPPLDFNGTIVNVDSLLIENENFLSYEILSIPENKVSSFVVKLLRIGNVETVGVSRTWLKLKLPIMLYHGFIYCFANETWCLNKKKSYREQPSHMVVVMWYMHKCINSGVPACLVICLSCSTYDFRHSFLMCLWHNLHGFVLPNKTLFFHTYFFILLPSIMTKGLSD